jgi:WD40 repeat protein
MAGCPTVDELRFFDEGLLPNPDIDRVAAHLSSGCSRCAEILDRFGDDDELTVALRTATDTKTLRPSPTLDRYQIVAEIGLGGMGTVFRAVDQQSGRTVALKQLTAKLASNPFGIARFRQEVNALARIEHPNVVRLYDADLDGDSPYLVMEFVDGGSLSKRANGRPMPPTEAAILIEKVARAVHAVHDAGVLHRDLKPGNILLTLSGEPKVSDFGLARSAGDSEVRLTQTGVLLGTPEYMPPEQAQGEWAALTPASDVYALGATLYELLTGRPPFLGPSALSVLDQVIRAEPLAPSELQPELPRDLQTICLKCLEKKPDARYASAAALADDLRRWQRGQPTLARATGRGERVIKWIHRNPATSAFLVVIAIVLLVGSVVSSSFAVRASRRAHDAQLARDGATQMAHDEQIARTAAEKTAYRLTIRDADREWIEGRADKAATILAACPEPLRNWEWNYLARRCGVDEALTNAPDGLPGSLALTSDGKRVRFLLPDGIVRELDIATHRETAQPLRVLDTGLEASVFGQNGNHVAVHRRGTDHIRVWNVNERRETCDVRWESKSNMVLALSRDGTWLAAGHTEGLAFRVWNVRTGAVVLDEVASLEGGREDKGKQRPRVFSLTFSRDGRRLAVGTHEQAMIWDLTSKKRISAKPGYLHSRAQEFRGVLNVSFTGPEDNQLITGGYVDPRVPDRAELLLHDLRNEMPSKVLAADQRQYVPFVISSDGSRVAYAASTAMMVVVRDAPTGKEISRIRLFGRSGGLAFSPDANHLLTGRGFRMWNVLDEAGGEIIRVQGCNRIFGLASTGDGQEVIFTVPGDATDPSQVRLCIRHRQSGTDAFLPLAIKDLAPSKLAMSPDGRTLAVALPKKLGGDGGHGVQLWDWRQRNQIALLTGTTADVSEVAFTSAGRIIAGVSNGSVLEWDPRSPNEPRQIYCHPDHLLSLALAPQGGTAAVGGYGKDGRYVAIVSLETGETVRVLDTGAASANSVAFSPDGRRLAISTYAPSTLQLWDHQSGELLARAVEPHNQPVPVTLFTTDGCRILTGSHDGNVKVWDAERCTELLVLRGHLGAVNRGVVLPNGMFFTSSWDGTVRMWDGRKAR